MRIVDWMWRKRFWGNRLTKCQLVASGIVFAIIALLLTLFCGLPVPLAKTAAKVPGTPAQARLLPVEILTLEALPAYRVTRVYTGMVVARQTSDLSFERGGKLVELTVDEGDRVSLGAPLATLDTQGLRATQRQLRAQRIQAQARLAEMRAGPRRETIEAAQAQVDERQAELALAGLQRRRRQYLLEKGVIAREAFDAADAGVKTWQARLEAAQRRLDELLAGTRREQIQAQEALVAQVDASLAAIEIDLDKSVLKAPFAGTVAKRLADAGMVVNAGQALFRLVEGAHPEVHVGLPPRVAATLTPGSRPSVHIGDDTHQAQVARILPELDAATRTVLAVLTLAAPGDRAHLSAVIPGQVARLELQETIDTPGFWLPLTALTKGTRGLWSCFVLVPDTEGDAAGLRTEHRLVEILHTENDRVFVRGLLQAGERVVKTGTHRLVAGQRVQVTP
jgi:RND family efflux transporter MFP subunit